MKPIDEEGLKELLAKKRITPAEFMKAKAELVRVSTPDEEEGAAEEAEPEDTKIADALALIATAVKSQNEFSRSLAGKLSQIVSAAQAGSQESAIPKPPSVIVAAQPPRRWRFSVKRNSEGKVDSIEAEVIDE